MQSMSSPDQTDTAELPFHHAASVQVLNRMREQITFQLSVDTDNLAQGLTAAEAAVAAGVTIVEMGTPLIKFEGAKNVVPAFRKRFPETLLLAGSENDGRRRRRGARGLCGRGQHR
jgi:hypothetical protein